ncbi:hypothetical protein LQ759_18900 [Serratia marcescens]|uniref:hypothetical protein n=1 Tax=Serratia TaxID=613 RepID=UPI001F2AE97D|nr:MULTISPECIES: hypothetical protein [Serratia]MCF1611958.1 hypothetical protein [Serratia marcescens]MDI6973403.1 hypothetical protein [Serratia sp. Se-RSBMAAmG]MDI9262372.1 hypothetical protein [Serratia sp. PF2-63]MDI9271224.1 hypothetical protein [Serratia sp. PF-27]
MNEQKPSRAEIRGRVDAMRRRKQLKEQMNPETKARLLKVTPQLFGSFLDAKGVSRRCLACRSHDLFVPISMCNNPDKPMTSFDPADLGTMENMYNGTMISYVTFTAIDSNEPYSLPNLQYCVTCQNCGFISSYRVGPVLNWIAPEEDKDEVTGDE